MEYSVRLNGFISKGYTFEQTLEAISKIDGATHVDLNYPEHFEGYSVEEMNELLKRYGLRVSSVASRFRKEYNHGEFTNPDPSLRQQAIQLAKETSDMAEAVGCNHIILWFGNDGWSYPFEVDYEQIWIQARDAIREVCDHNKNVAISIEYKPYEPRSYTIFSSAAVTAMMAHEVDRSNIYVTIDLAHVYMKGEMPGFSVALLFHSNLLSAVHVNDGYGMMDDGLMVGSVSFVQTLEFYYYLLKNKYDKAIYFDTFPIRENPVREVEQNIRMSNKIIELINKIGLSRIAEIISKNDAVAAQEIMFECLK